MKLLTLHSDFIEFEAKQKAIKDAEEVEKGEKRFEECLVVLSTVERADESNPEAVAKNVASEIMNIAAQVKTKTIVIFPYAHLSKELAAPSVAKKVLTEIGIALKKEKYEVHYAPFGWYKQLHIQVKGHPLAELSREIHAERLERKPAKIEEEFWVLENGRLIEPEKWNGKSELFRILLDKEALKKELKGGEPDFIKQMQKFGIEWEPMSDLGHMRYNPLGAFIFDSISEYAKQTVESMKIPTYHIRGTNMFNLNERAIREHAELFGDRLYEVEVDKKRFVLRYAACFQQFALMKDWVISYKNLPMGALEIADSYRLEQSGELLLSFRVRKMHMPDFHILCKDIEQSKELCIKLHKRIYEEFGKLGHDLVCLYNLTKSFYENNKEFFKSLEKIEGKPLLLRFIPENRYYWVVNVEHHIIDRMKRPREIGTWQIDVGNAERFGIKYTDKDNVQKRPAIIHTAILGTIERYIYSVFDSALKHKNPVLPLWLTPVQVRLCPINDSFNEYCEKIAEEMASQNIRVDIDDRIESIDKKIRNAESELWIPYIVVVGEKEKNSGEIAVRYRESGKVESMKPMILTKIILNQTKGYPFKPLPLPLKVSQRPSFS